MTSWINKFIRWRLYSTLIFYGTPFLVMYYLIFDNTGGIRQWFMVTFGLDLFWSWFISSLIIATPLDLFFRWTLKFKTIFNWLKLGDSKHLKKFDWRIVYADYFREDPSHQNVDGDAHVFAKWLGERIDKYV